MGYATIVSGGADGRYSIALDYGSTTRTALLSALNALVAEITVKMAAAQLKVTEAEVKEATARGQVEAAQNAFIAAASAAVPGAPRPSTSAIQFELQQLKRLQLAHEGLRRSLDALKFDMKVAQLRVNYWTNFTPTETRNAWCVDLTEDATPGQVVATVDIPGESNLLLIAPGARAWTGSDGVLSARELMSPEQAFFNAAILPGWQKYLPTYRWGTITALDIGANTATVALFDAVSSAQRLPINQAGTLSGVPVEYMTCNAAAFDVGDDVVVQFVGQDWGDPKVIGFLNDPKPCITWPNVTVRVGFEVTSRTSNGVRNWISSTSYNATCDVTQLGLFGSVVTADSATSQARFHTITLGSGADPSAVLDCDFAVDDVVYSVDSSAFEFGGSTSVPSADVGTWAYAVTGLGVQIQQATVLSSVVTLSGGYDGACVPAYSFTGGLFDSSSTTALVNEASLEAWLTSLGKLPTITVTIGSRTRNYIPVAGTDSVGTDPDIWIWGMTYIPEPY